MRQLLLLAFFAFGLSSANAQSWQTSFAENRSFIENKGQFGQRAALPDSEILYAIDEGSAITLFRKNGVTFCFEQKPKNPDRIRGDRQTPRRYTEREKVSFVWEGASTNVEVIAQSPMPDRHAYAMRGQDRQWYTLEEARGFGRITYKGLYPGIDVEYEIHPDRGFKYTIVVHPGANPNQVRMRYADGTKLSIDPSGNVVVGTAFGPITDHAPFTFSDHNKQNVVRSAFALSGTTVRFSLGEFDTQKTLSIDPWTVSPSFSNSNKIWEIETDAANNVYVYGGDTPIRVRKYNSTGTLQWTYNTPYDTANYWLGTMLCDPQGNCYITASTDPVIAKINTNMGITWSNTGGGFDEYWRMAFNCDRTKLMMGGTRLVIGPSLFPIGYGRAFDMNMNNGAQISSVNVAVISPGFGGINNADEIRALCASPNGKYYYMTLDTIGELNQNMTHGWRRPNGYGFSYGVAGYAVTNLGINGIAATSDFLYTLNGSTLHKRNINNGNIIATATIPGGVTQSQLGYNSAMNGGLVIDDCGNLYVGSGSSVVKFNGSTLQQMGTASVSGAVYDVAINGSEIVACGNGFVASVSGLSPCAVPQAVCLDCLELEDAGPFCQTDAAVNLVSNMPGGTWSGPGITNASTGTFNPATAGPGTHTITYNPPTTPPCGQNTISIVVNNCANISVCINTNGSLTASGGVGSYTWQNQTTTQDCSSCLPPPFPACSFPPGCATTVTSWNTFATTATATPPGTFPIRVQDSAGNEVVLTTISGLPSCQVCNMSAFVSDQQDVSCFGGSNGSASVSVNGAPGATTYVWTPGNLTGNTQNGLSAGVYTVTATSDNCSATTTVTISQPSSAVSASINESTQPGCGQSNGSATVIASGGTPGYTYSWSPSGGSQATANGLSAGPYTITVTDVNGCTATANVALNSANAPTINVINTQNVSCFGGNDGSATVSASGGIPNYSYQWANNQSGPTASGLSAGQTSVTVTDQNGCSTTQTITISQPTALTATATGGTTPCGQNGGTATVTPSGGTPGYTYSWSPSGGSQATANGLGGGIFTVTVTDANGCITTATATITNTGGPTVQITNTQNVSCAGGSNGSATLSASGGGAPYTYSWSPSNQAGPTLSNASAGTYSYVVTNSLGCVTTGEVTITQPSALWPNATATNVSCKGYQDGEISSSPVGGTPPYTYSWSNGANGPTIAGLASGSYSLTVADANGCTHDTSFVIVFVINFSASISQSGNTLTANAPGAISYQWYLNNQPISGATGATYTYTQSGNYYVLATDANGCEAASNIIEATYIGVDESVFGSFAIGLDPTNDQINISGNRPLSSVTRWQLQEATGRVVRQGWMVNGQLRQTVDMTGLANGVYIVSLTADQGKFARKVVWAR